MKRREFLLILNYLALFLITGCKIKDVTEDPLTVFKRILKQVVPYLYLKDSVIFKFIEDLKREDPVKYKLIFDKKIVFEDEVKIFLMSTDFFRKKDIKNIGYNFYYNPKKYPCRNPFAEF